MDANEPAIARGNAGEAKCVCICFRGALNVFPIGLATVSKTVSKKTIGSTKVSKTVSNFSIGLGHIEFEIALFFCII